ncbi:hypothetical protein CH252_04455 [Rhodococcus sp. 06-1477-1B]|nr:hypothetical protein CH252_04455 [Rhodococcus sp. 06-1477-1B]
MTGTWEQRLTNFAEGGVPWDVPSRSALTDGLSALRDVLNRVASDPGLTGAAGTKAQSTFSSAASQIAQQIAYIEDELAQGLLEANDVRSRARDALGSLPSGSLSGGQEAAVRGAAAGMTLMLGPISFLAGEGAVGVINNYLSDQREAAARESMEKFSDQMDAVSVSEPPEFRVDTSDEIIEPTQPGGGGTGGGGGGRSGGRSFEQYPEWNSNPGVANPSSNDGGQSQPEYHTMPQPHVIGPRPDGPINGDIPIIDLDNIKPEPTPDGSIIGTPNLPGPFPSAPGGGLLGGSGGAGAGIGSGLGAGLIAGGGGAAALGSIARGAGAPGGSLFSGAGGTAASGAAGRSGGLLGKTATGGSGLGARGVGGMGGAAGGGAPGSTTAKGAGMRSGSVGGGTAGGGAAGGGAAGGGARGAGAGSRGVGGMGGPGSRSDRRDEASRGLGGPIAPRMEDDEEIGPRSENAQAGGRDE